MRIPGLMRIWVRILDVQSTVDPETGQLKTGARETAITCGAAYLAFLILNAKKLSSEQLANHLFWMLVVAAVMIMGAFGMKDILFRLADLAAKHGDKTKVKPARQIPPPPAPVGDDYDVDNGPKPAL